MEENGELHANAFDFSDDELVRELLDDKTPFLISPTAIEPEPALNRFLSKFYSGPTIGEIETALATATWDLYSKEPQVSQPTVSMLEKGLERGKMENKYTLKIKTFGNAPAEDGYKWRKYGQKSIKNSPNPRSYYRCTNPRCSAKKQVERSSEEADTMLITYEGLHLHFAYSNFQLSQPPPYSFSPLANANHKRPKSLSGPTDQPPLMAGRQQQPQLSSPARLNSEGAAPVGGSHQGLLQDIVPSLVRNPLNDMFSTTCSPAATSSSPSSSSASSSLVSWSPGSPFDVDILPTSYVQDETREHI